MKQLIGLMSLLIWCTAFHLNAQEPWVAPKTNDCLAPYHSLLLHLDGDEGSTDIIDSSPSAHHVTTHGDVHIATGQVLGSGCLHFDGATHRMSLPDHNDWYFGTNDFTIDFWLKTYGGSGTIVSQYNASPGTPELSFRIYTHSGTVRVYFGGHEGAPVQLKSDFTTYDGNWHHIAVVRHGDRLVIYYNGSWVDSGTITGPVQDFTGRLFIGDVSPEYQTSTNSMFHGWLDELRITKGLALWTTSYFSPPSNPECANQPPMITMTEPNGAVDITDLTTTIEWTDHDPDDNAVISLYYDNDDTGEDGTRFFIGLNEDDAADRYVWNTSAMPEGDYYIYAVIEDGVNPPVVSYSSGPVTVLRSCPNPKTSLLLHMDGADGVTDFIDESPAAHPVTAHGNVHLSTAEPKLGAAAAYFDGSSGYLSIPDSDDWAFGSGDFTIDFRIKTPGSMIDLVVNQYNYSPAVDEHSLQIYTYQGVVVVFIEGNTVSPVWLTGTIEMEDDQWHHVAVVRYANTLTLYVDGIPDVSTIISGSLDNLNGPLYIGDAGPEYQGAGNNWFGGYLDEFRITKGAALWTGAFTPPSTPYCSLNTTAPDITLTEPDGAGDTAVLDYTIRWVDDDVDHNALISLYYDNDQTGQDGQLIVSGLYEDDFQDYYTWDTTNLAPGDYYIYAVIDDGEHPPQARYSLGTMTRSAIPTATVSGGGTICPGQSTTVRVDLTGMPPWQLVWSDGATHDNVTASPFLRPVSPLADATYTVTGVSDMLDTGVAAGSAAVTVVSEQIEGHPQSVTVCPGSSAIFSVTASSGHASYQWLHDGMPIPGETAPVLTIGAVGPEDVGGYSCQVTGNCGTETSDPATLSLLPGAAGSLSFSFQSGGHGSLEGAPGLALRVPLQLDNPGVAIEGLTLTLSFDPSMLSFVSVDQDGTLMQDWSLFVNPGTDQLTLSGGTSAAVTTSGVLLYLDFLVNAEALPDQCSTLAFQNIQVNEENYCMTLNDADICMCRKGDVTGNGSITAFDGAQILKYAVGLPTPYDPLDPCRADTNCNGVITPLDASEIFRFTADLISGFCQSGPPRRTNMGSVMIPEQTLPPDHELRLPVLPDEVNGRDIRSFWFILTYNPDILDVTGIDTTGTLLENAGWMIMANAGQPGEIIVAGAGSQPLEGSAPLLHLAGEAIGWGNASLDFSFFQFDDQPVDTNLMPSIQSIPGMRLIPPVAVRGLLPLTFEITDLCCQVTSIEWLDPIAGLIGTGNVLTLDPPPATTTAYQVVLNDQGVAAPTIRTATVLAGRASRYFDMDGDGCNTARDLRLAAQEWLSATIHDADGDGRIDIRDLLYINTTAGCLP